MAIVIKTPAYVDTNINDCVQVSIELLRPSDGAVGKATTYTYLPQQQGLSSSTVSNRFATANNKYLDNYNSSLPTSHILSMDVVNLYGYCMLSKLPCGNFRFLVERSRMSSLKK